MVFKVQANLKAISLLIITTVFVLSLPMISMSESFIPTSGTCGSTADWSCSGGVLTITGDGAIDDYTETTMPWYSIKDSIESAVISEGITRIGEYAFY
ncbi:MAG: hypothetical protein II879_10675, partial [Clostridia bacterium]|nr:hypothetical protein [Clostridia bacterium]